MEASWLNVVVTAHPTALQPVKVEVIGPHIPLPRQSCHYISCPETMEICNIAFKKKYGDFGGTIPAKGDKIERRIVVFPVRVFGGDVVTRDIVYVIALRGFAAFVGGEEIIVELPRTKVTSYRPYGIVVPQS